MEDCQIVELYWKREEGAVRETERKYSRFCFGIAWKVLFDREDCEECVNDTWFAAWNAIPPKRPTILFSFLGRITRNLAIDRFRKKAAGKRVNLHMEDICGEVERLGGLITYTLDDHNREKELIQVFDHFLECLSLQDRDIFIRRYWFMDSIREIAGRQGCSESRVKSSLFCSRKKLGVILKEESL